MWEFLLRRTGTMLLSLLVISALIFAIVQLPPGDFLSHYMAELQSQGQEISQKRLDFLRKTYGLDRTLVEQYGVWVWGLLQGDFGYSYEYQRPVAEVVGDRALLTVVLNLGTIAFIYAVSFPLGLYAATRPYSVGDYGLTFLGFLGLATPNFLLALVLLYLANIWFGTSIGGLMAPEYVDAPWSPAKALSVLEHLVVPVMVIGTAGTAAMIRRLRANLLDELHRPHVTAARAKGLSGPRLLVKYPLRLAVIPFIADIGSLLPQVVSGSVIVSTVMSLPTTGPILLSALRSQDTYLAASFLFLISVLTVVGMFVSDLLLAVVDPRIRFQGRRS